MGTKPVTFLIPTDSPRTFKQSPKCSAIKMYCICAIYFGSHLPQVPIEYLHCGYVTEGHFRCILNFT